MPIDVSGGKSKKKYKMTVGDTGRTFHDDETGEDLDETTFKEREGDYSTAGGSETVKSYYQKSDKNGRVSERVQVKAAPVVRQDPPTSLGEVARRNAQPTPTPTPDPEKKKKQTSALSRKSGGYYG